MSVGCGEEREKKRCFMDLVELAAPIELRQGRSHAGRIAS